MKKFLALLLLVLGMLLVACGESPTVTPAVTPTTVPTEAATVALPTPASRKIPTQVTASYLVPAPGQPHLGGPVSTFFSAFRGSDASSAQPDPDGINTDYGVLYDPRVSGPLGQCACISLAASPEKKVVDILIIFPQKTPQPWTQEAYLTYTKEFLPPDAVQGSTTTPSNGVTIHYTSQIAGPFSLSVAYGARQGSLDTPAFQ